VEEGTEARRHAGTKGGTSKEGSSEFTRSLNACSLTPCLRASVPPCLPSPEVQGFAASRANPRGSPKSEIRINDECSNDPMAKSASALRHSGFGFDSGIRISSFVLPRSGRRSKDLPRAGRQRISPRLAPVRRSRTTPGFEIALDAPPQSKMKLDVPDSSDEARPALQVGARPTSCWRRPWKAQAHRLARPTARTGSKHLLESCERRGGPSSEPRRAELTAYRPCGSARS